MSLRERLVHSGGAGGSAVTGPAAAKDEIKRSLHRLIVEDLSSELDQESGDEAGLRLKVESMALALLDQESTPLSLSDRREIATDVANNVVGYGPITEFLDDPTVTEIMVNNPSTIYIERLGKIHETEARFLDESHLRRIIDKIVGQVGRRVDEASPMVDARLPDGSRVNAVVHPLAINGPMLTIRKFSRDPYTAEDLIRFGTMNEHAASLLEACVQGRMNILISGGTGTGKTTLLNVVSKYVPSDERIITVEDAAELRLHQPHVLRLEGRPANLEGKGQVAIRDLVKNTLRMRPDRIIVGEVRGAEALDMLQAMNTGHDGSLTTVHANTPRDALARIETMVLMSGYDLPIRAIRQQMSSALDVVVQMARLRDGTRRITHITEVEGMEGDAVVMQDLAYFDFSMGVDDTGRFLGHLKSTGLRPKFSRHLEDLGIALPPELFEYEPPARA